MVIVEYSAADLRELAVVFNVLTYNWVFSILSFNRGEGEI